MFYRFFSMIKTWISDPLGLDKINLKFDSPVTNIDGQFTVPDNRSVLWALISSSNEMVGIYTPSEVELIFIRVLSKNKLYTDGVEVFQVMEL